MVSTYKLRRLVMVATIVQNQSGHLGAAHRVAFSTQDIRFAEEQWEKGEWVRESPASIPSQDASRKKWKGGKGRGGKKFLGRDSEGRERGRDNAVCAEKMGVFQEVAWFLRRGGCASQPAWFGFLFY